ncbi:hypothetical protein CYMTET_27316 [Cymbomonas tetramitiformis]|uniref:Uncharacterized protein n=1 Tax=Cymbomonas tetramitiformis TaxID=36881 RepID=A0AAE0KX45_9CHLO|nr:hypothetical protein CYMTET_27316 [Cymbomonas tetramitiformis]
MGTICFVKRSSIMVQFPGYADVGTMLGSRLLASTTEEAGRSMSRMTRRLLLLGVSTGLLAAGIFFGLRDSIIHVFAASADAEVSHVLRGVWIILTALQPFNALVFVYDGLLYAAHSFVFVRNVFIIGVLGIFLPVLITADLHFHTLAAIWSAKVGLNLWRVGSSFFHINLQLEPAWLNRSPMECE